MSVRPTRRGTAQAKQQSSYTQLESLLLAQTVWELGANSESWSNIAKLLSSHPLISRPKSFFTAQSCLAVYERMMKEASLERTDLDAGIHAPQNLALARKHFQLRFSELLHLITVEENNFRSIASEIDDIRAGLHDERIKANLSGVPLEAVKAQAPGVEQTDEIFGGSDLTGVTDSGSSGRDEDNSAISPMPQLPKVHLLDGIDESGRTHGSSEPELRVLTNSTSPLDGSEEAEGLTLAVPSNKPHEAVPAPTMISEQLNVNDAPPELPVDAGMADLFETRNCAEEKQSLIQRQEEEEGDYEVNGEEEEEEVPLEAKVEEEETDHEETKLPPPFTDATETASEDKTTSPPAIIETKMGEVVNFSDLDGPVSEEEPAKAARRSARRRKSSTSSVPPLQTRGSSRRRRQTAESEPSPNEVDSEADIDSEMKIDMLQVEGRHITPMSESARRREGKRKASPLEAVEYQREKKRVREDSEPVDDDESGPSSHNTRTRPIRQGTRTEEQVALKRFQSVIGLLHSQISQHRNGNIFHNPIKNSEAPDYHDIVKRPMDLKTIKTRVKDGLVANSLEFQRDIFLMFANAMMYNRPGSDVHAMAEDMMIESEGHILSFRQTEGYARGANRA